ncbi:MAG TPA: DUF1614 domain-containing protein [Candidatus Bathyarchaeota archaeon]|nr:DUF1614 domain-containing protein [Candidatus Bathyarchaeota archaeon]
MPEDEEKIVIYNPMTVSYIHLLIVLTLFMIPFMFLAWRIMSYTLRVPYYLIFFIFLFSLYGSSLNIKLWEVRSMVPMLTLTEVAFFGIRWQVPEVKYEVKRTVIAINVGGAIIPMLFSLYLLLYSIPMIERSLILAYLKILIATAIVTVVVHVFAKPVKGLGIAVPSFIPPFTSALAAAVVYRLITVSNPFIIAYISGTWGTLIGADLLNLRKVSELGAPVVSIGGAGVFDGIYMTGISAVFLLFLLLY